MTSPLILGDCLEKLGEIPSSSVDLIYVDPPFFTQKTQRLTTKDGSTEYAFSDTWKDHSEYMKFIELRMAKCREKLKESGCLFFHCHRSASHMVRFILEEIFGPENFRSEIIWSFKRWSNAKKGLLNSHQNIYFFSKSDDFKFNTMYTDYALSTNVDQILQKRARDYRGKSTYAKDHSGEVIFGDVKKGVPLGDVWQIPFLNPKAKERVGYPTQKPIELMERILELTTDPGDLVVDPFCGSGSTLVAAHLMGRRFIGIDLAPEALELTQKRLAAPIVSRSSLSSQSSYKTHSDFAQAHLMSLPYTPVHRNKGIDGVLKHKIQGRCVFLRVQREGESLEEAAAALKKATQSKGLCLKVLISTHGSHQLVEGIHVISSTKSAFEHQLPKNPSL